MVIKHSFSFRHLACHGWWKHKTSPPSPPKGTMRRAAQGWAQGMFPTGPAATSSPRRGAAGPWLKMLCTSVLPCPTHPWGREAALDMSCSSWVGATVCCPGKSTSLEHPPATAPHSGFCTKASGIALAIPVSAVCSVAADHPQRMPAMGLRSAPPSHKEHLSSTLQCLDHNFLTSSVSNCKSNL